MNTNKNGGMFFGSSIFTVRPVARAVEPLMYVVPQGLPRVISARVESVHVDQLHSGRGARLRFLSFDRRWTPEVGGTISRISADSVVDQGTGESFYQVELYPDPSEMPKLDGLVLVPGMPVEVFINTGVRSPIAYLTKPLFDYFNRAWREN